MGILKFRVHQKCLPVEQRANRFILRRVSASTAGNGKWLTDDGSSWKSAAVIAALRREKSTNDCSALFAREFEWSIDYCLAVTRLAARRLRRSYGSDWDAI